ncbi:MAG: transposase [candidate division KSB1 bacterium]|nr:transposase [candidate division KSB1 bacterium]
MRDRYKILTDEGIYFLTSTIVEWLPVFTKRRYFEIIIDSLNYCMKYKNLELYAYVILDNHLHLVAAAENLRSVVASFRKFTSKAIIKQLELDQMTWLLNQLKFYKKAYKTESRYQVWQEGMHPKYMQSPDMMRQKIEYIHRNPVERGYVQQPEHWVYSSARNYFTEDESIIYVERDWGF